jgi:hypothetical protein
MSAAYVDSSVITGVAFVEGAAAGLVERLRQFDQLFSAPLLEAEVRSAARREEATIDEGWFAPLTWVHPERSLSAEIVRVLRAGYLRGADCWHLAMALHLVPDPSELTFLTLDLRQREIATALGFTT